MPARGCSTANKNPPHHECPQFRTGRPEPRPFSFGIRLDGALPPAVDLFDLEFGFGGVAARGTYIGPPDHAGLQQINAVLNENHRTGLLPAELLWFGEPLCPASVLRVIPPGPQVPQIDSVTDGINLLSGTLIESGCVKVGVVEVDRIEEFQVAVDGDRITGLDGSAQIRRRPGGR